MLLTAEERQRFIAYLTNEVNSSRAIIEQMERIKSPEVIVRAFKMEAAAYEVVRNKLASVESVTIEAER